MHHVITFFPFLVDVSAKKARTQCLILETMHEASGLILKEMPSRILLAKTSKF
jgi:hypothetical protein